MARLFNAFLFKIRRDLTFRITLIVGVALAVVMAALYGLIDALDNGTMMYLTGQTMLINSVSPVQNFGLAIPINLISFTCLEFTQGTIRNKIIAGNSKFKIYMSLLLSGLVFTFVLLFVYLGLCTLLGTIFGGFDIVNKPVVLLSSIGSGLMFATGPYILQTLLISILIYAMVTALAIFIATAFRVIGPTIPIVVITLMAGYFASVIIFAGYRDNTGLINTMRFINPLFGLIDVTADSSGHLGYSGITLIGSVVCNLGYAAIFTVAGCLLFMKRDVK